MYLKCIAVTVFGIVELTQFVDLLICLKGPIKIGNSLDLTVWRCYIIGPCLPALDLQLFDDKHKKYILCFIRLRKKKLLGD